jgi:hypothetical protein
MAETIYSNDPKTLIVIRLKRIRTTPKDGGIEASPGWWACYATPFHSQEGPTSRGLWVNRRYRSSLGIWLNFSNIIHLFKRNKTFI